jgi:ArsR family transcriptional regulator, arsenate/arsenite/antimonite-responsive transcriptional repressor
MVISAKHDVIEVIGLLADPVRAQIVQVLAQGPACVCHLVEDLNLKQPNISNHIRVLRHAGLIRGENRGKFTFYRLNTDALDAATTHLAQLADTARAHAGAYRECS